MCLFFQGFSWRLFEFSVSAESFWTFSYTFWRSLCNETLTLENAFGSPWHHLAVLSMTIEDSVDFAFVWDIFQQNRVLVLHVIEITKSHFWHKGSFYQMNVYLRQKNCLLLTQWWMCFTGGCNAIMDFRCWQALWRDLRRGWMHNLHQHFEAIGTHVRILALIFIFLLMRLGCILGPADFCLHSVIEILVYNVPFGTKPTQTAAISINCG